MVWKSDNPFVAGPMSTVLLVISMTIFDIDCDGLNQYFSFHTNAIPLPHSDHTVPKYVLWNSIEELERKTDAVVLGLMNSTFFHSTELDFSLFTNLRQLSIGYNCLINVHRLVINDLNELEHISIKENSFTLYNQEIDESTNGFFVWNCSFAETNRDW